MKHLKMLALAALAAGALMTLIGAGTASATVICSTTADPCPAGQKGPAGTKLDFSLAAGTSSNWQETAEGGGETLDTCKSSTVEAEITNAGSATQTVTGPITKLTWGTCAFPTTTTLKGKPEVHRIGGTSNGTVTADGESRWTTNTNFFGSCIYTVPSGNSIGDITEGNPAVFHVNAVVRQVSENLVCPTTATWTATYTLTEPSSTTLSISSS